MPFPSFFENADKMRTRKVARLNGITDLGNKELQGMAQTNYYIGGTTNSAGESKIICDFMSRGTFGCISTPEYGSTANAGVRKTTSISR